MKTIVWDDTFSVEVEEIDEDHRRLVDLFNMLSQAVADGESADYIDALLEELISCTVWHFRHEERLMLKHQYPNIAEHKAEHQDLIDSVKKLQQSFHQDEKKLSPEDIDYLEDWLTAHIFGFDMKMGFYLLEVM